MHPFLPRFLRPSSYRAYPRPGKGGGREGGREAEAQAGFVAHGWVGVGGGDVAVTGREGHQQQQQQQQQQQSGGQ